MILRWSPFKIVSVSAVLYPRWPPLLKIEISSNGQNCSILSQKGPKFELYKHNDVFSDHLSNVTLFQHYFGNLSVEIKIQKNVYLSLLMAFKFWYEYACFKLGQWSMFIAQICSIIVPKNIILHEGQYLCNDPFIVWQ